MYCCTARIGEPSPITQFDFRYLPFPSTRAGAAPPRSPGHATECFLAAQSVDQLVGISLGPSVWLVASHFDHFMSLIAGFLYPISGLMLHSAHGSKHKRMVLAYLLFLLIRRTVFVPLADTE